MESNVRISREELESFRDNLRQLANALQDYYDELNSNLNRLHDAWQDDQFEQFESDFQEDKVKIMEIRERIEEWANQRLEKLAEKTEKVKGIQNFK
jgi:uncharacterized protein YukE